MKPHETSDITRGLEALRRLWWAPIGALVLGAVLAVATADRDNATTFESVVATPPLAISSSFAVDPTLPLDALAADLQSADVAQELGENVEGVQLAATVAADRTSVSVTGTAGDAESARRGTEAYAERLAESYREVVAARLDRVVASFDEGIATLNSNAESRSPRDAGTLAELTVQRELVVSLMADAPEVPEGTQVASGSAVLPTVLLTALAFGLLATGIVALSGLSTRRLRFRDDVEQVTGSGTLIAELDGRSGARGAAEVIDRLAASAPVALVPVGDRPIDDVRATLKDEGGSQALAPVTATSSPGAADHVVLVVRLGRDKRSELDLAHRASSLAGGRFAGVIAVNEFRRRQAPA